MASISGAHDTKHILAADCCCRLSTSAATTTSIMREQWARMRKKRRKEKCPKQANHRCHCGCWSPSAINCFQCRSNVNTATGEIVTRHSVYNCQLWALNITAPRIFMNGTVPATNKNCDHQFICVHRSPKRTSCFMSEKTSHLSMCLLLMLTTIGTFSPTIALSPAAPQDNTQPTGGEQQFSQEVSLAQRAGSSQPPQDKTNSVPATSSAKLARAASASHHQIVHHTMEGVVGNKLIIPCNISPPTSDDAISLILWFKDESTVPIYSVDARVYPIGQARHKAGAWLEGRSSLQIVTADSNNAAPANSDDPTGDRYRHRHRRRSDVGNDRKRRHSSLEHEPIGQQINNNNHDYHIINNSETRQLLFLANKNNASTNGSDDNLNRLSVDRFERSVALLQTSIYDNQSRQKAARFQHSVDSDAPNRPNQRIYHTRRTGRTMNDDNGDQDEDTVVSESDRTVLLTEPVQSRSQSAPNKANFQPENIQQSSHRKNRKRRHHQAGVTSNHQIVNGQQLPGISSANEKKQQELTRDLIAESMISLPMLPSPLRMLSSGGAASTSGSGFASGGPDMIPISRQLSSFDAMAFNGGEHTARLIQNNDSDNINDDNDDDDNSDNDELSSASGNNQALNGETLSGDNNNSKQFVKTQRTRTRNSKQKHLIANLQIDTLIKEDQGDYTCRVDFRKSKSRNSVTSLKMIVPPNRPVIRDRNRQTLVGPELAGQAASASTLVGPYNENEQVILICESQGGQPLPQITWWRDNKQMIDDSYEMVFSNGQTIEVPNQLSSVNEDFLATISTITAAPSNQQTSSDETVVTSMSSLFANTMVTLRNTLELGPLTRHHLMANYSCRASNNNLTAPATSSVTLEVNFPPLRVEIDNERQALISDKPVDIVCRAYGSRPAATITWLLGGTKLTAAASQRRSGDDQRHLSHRHRQHQQPEQSQQQQQQSQPFSIQISEKITPDGNITVSTLRYTPQIEDSGQSLVCRAENQLTGGAASSFILEDSWKLEVQYVPQVHLALGEKLRHAHIQEGNDVYFECTIKAHPWIHEVRWWFEGKELETNVSLGVIISNQSLVLQRVQRAQRGRYTCSAINSLGEGQSNSVHLRILFAPVCRQNTGQQPLTGSAPQSVQADRRSAPAADSDGQHGTDSGADSGAQTGNNQGSGGSSNQHKMYYGAARSEPVRVLCQVDADPPDSLTFRWSFQANGPAASAYQTTSTTSDTATTGTGSGAGAGQLNMVPLDGQSYQTPPNDPLASVALYTPHSELDYGQLLCWAQNSIGQQVHACRYHVVPAERPDPVRDCRLANSSDTSMVIVCVPGYDGGVDQTFQMEIYDVINHRLVANLSTTAQMNPGAKWAGPEQQQQQNNGSWSAARQQQPAASGKTGPTQQLALLQTTTNQRQLTTGQMVSSPVSLTGSGSDEPSVVVSSSLSPLSASSLLSTAPAGNGGNGPALEAVFLAEQLRPLTDYFLSVYSVNSRGASKPIAFTASTMATQSTLGSSDSGASSGEQREPRRADHSQLLSNVLQLSWSPFIAIIMLTLGSFLLLGLLGYVTIKCLNGSPSGHNSNNRSNSKLALSQHSSKGSCDLSRGARGATYNSLEKTAKHQEREMTQHKLGSSISSSASNYRLANGANANNNSKQIANKQTDNNNKSQPSLYAGHNNTNNNNNNSLASSSTRSSPTVVLPTGSASNMLCRSSAGLLRSHAAPDSTASSSVAGSCSNGSYNIVVQHTGRPNNNGQLSGQQELGKAAHCCKPLQYPSSISHNQQQQLIYHGHHAAYASSGNEFNYLGGPNGLADRPGDDDDDHVKLSITGEDFLDSSSNSYHQTDNNNLHHFHHHSHHPLATEESQQQQQALMDNKQHMSAYQHHHPSPATAAIVCLQHRAMLSAQAAQQQQQQLTADQQQQAVALISMDTCKLHPDMTHLVSGAMQSGNLSVHQQQQQQQQQQISSRPNSGQTKTSDLGDELESDEMPDTLNNNSRQTTMGFVSASQIINETTPNSCLPAGIDGAAVSDDQAEQVSNGHSSSTSGHRSLSSSGDQQPLLSSSSAQQQQQQQQQHHHHHQHHLQHQQASQQQQQQRQEFIGCDVTSSNGILLHHPIQSKVATPSGKSSVNTNNNNFIINNVPKSGSINDFAPQTQLDSYKTHSTYNTNSNGSHANNNINNKNNRCAQQTRNKIYETYYKNSFSNANSRIVNGQYVSDATDSGDTGKTSDSASPNADSISSPDTSSQQLMYPTLMEAARTNGTSNIIDFDHMSSPSTIIANANAYILDYVGDTNQPTGQSSSGLLLAKQPASSNGFGNRGHKYNTLGAPSARRANQAHQNQQYVLARPPNEPKYSQSIKLSSYDNNYLHQHADYPAVMLDYAKTRAGDTMSSSPNKQNQQQFHTLQYPKKVRVISSAHRPQAVRFNDNPQQPTTVINHDHTRDNQLMTNNNNYPDTTTSSVVSSGTIATKNASQLKSAMMPTKAGNGFSSSSTISAPTEDFNPDLHTDV